MKVFITGDRSAPAELALLPVTVLLAREFVTAATDYPDGSCPIELVTGDLPGTETAVQIAAKLLGLEPAVVPSGDPWNVRAEMLKQFMHIDRVLFFHADPHASRMLPPLLEVFGDAVEIVSPELLLV